MKYGLLGALAGLAIGGFTITLMGQTPPPDLGQKPASGMSTGAFGGAVNAYTMPAPNPMVTSNSPGYRVCGSFPAGVAKNTGDSTLAVGRAAPLHISKNNASGLLALSGGDITGQVQSTCFQLDGTAAFWIMQDQPGSETFTDFNGTISSSQWTHGDMYRYVTPGKTLILPPAGSGITPNSYIILTAMAPVTLQPSTGDVINKGFNGDSSISGTTLIPAGNFTMVQTGGVAGPLAYTVPIANAAGSGGPTGGSGPTFFNSADAASGFTVSTTNYTNDTISNSVIQNWRGIRTNIASPAKTTGKWHFEVQVKAYDGGSGWAMGISNGASDLVTPIGINPNGTSGMRFNLQGPMPNVRMAEDFNSSNLGGQNFTLAVNDWLAVEVDFDNNRIWWQDATVGTGWSAADPANNFTGNPAGNTGGMDITSLVKTGGLMIYCMIYNQVPPGIPGSNQCVLNPGILTSGHAFVAPVSANFLAWDH